MPDPEFSVTSPHRPGSTADPPRGGGADTSGSDNGSDPSPDRFRLNIAMQNLLARVANLEGTQKPPFPTNGEPGPDGFNFAQWHKGEYGRKVDGTRDMARGVEAGYDSKD